MRSIFGTCLTVLVLLCVLFLGRTLFKAYPTFEHLKAGVLGDERYFARETIVLSSDEDLESAVCIIDRLLIAPKRKSPLDDRDQVIALTLNSFLGTRLHLPRNGPGRAMIVFLTDMIHPSRDFDVHAAALAQNTNAAVLVVDYLGSGHSSGAREELWKEANGMMCDVTRQVTVLTTHLKSHFEGYDVSVVPMFVLGHALGTVSALGLAFERPSLHGVILEAPPATAMRVVDAELRGKNADLRGELEMPPLPCNCSELVPAHVVQNLTLPLLVISPSMDKVFPLGDAELLYEQAGSQHKELVVLDTVSLDTMILQAHTQYFRAINTFLDKFVVRQGGVVHN